jgi:hypothetical protein
VTIAIAGIVATLAAGLLAAVISAHSQRDTQKDSQVAQAKDADQKELRKVVDEAALAVLRADQARKSAQFAVYALEGDEFGPGPEARRVIGAFNGRISAMDGPQARLTIRLGDKHPLTQAFLVTKTALRNVADCLPSSLRGASPDLAAPDVERAVARFNSEAARLVGSRLGSPPRSSQPRDSFGDLRKRVEAQAQKAC